MIRFSYLIIQLIFILFYCICFERTILVQFLNQNETKKSKSNNTEKYHG